MEDDRVYTMVEMLRSELNRMQEEWKLRETRILETLRLEKIEFEHRLQFVTGIFTEVKRMLKNPSRNPDPKTMELRFSNKISQPILTGDEIKAEDNTCIEVSLLDSSTGNIVNIEPVASASVEIVVLGQGTDDWTGEEFNEKIVRVEGKPFLTVDVCELQRGVGILENVRFRHHATDVKPSEFRLGARIAEKFDGIIVKEAKTESFVVKSYRCKYSKKNEIPSLSDKIWVLKNIQRRGKIDERLQAEGIDTIEKFLIQLLINDQELKTIVGLGRKKWEATVNHARKCESDKVYWYINSQENSGIGVLFDILGKLQGLYSESQFVAANMLSENMKADADNLLSSAFENWKNVKPFDDLNSLHQYLAAIKPSLEPSNSCIPGHPVTNPDAGASEMLNESNNIEVPDPLLDQGIFVSDTTSFERCDSFGIDDVEYMHDFPLGLSQRSDSDFSMMLFDVNGYGVQQQYFIGEMNTHDARLDGTGSSSVGSEVVVPGSSKTPRKWKTLFCLSKWIFTRKMFKSDDHPARKKQKICKNTLF